MKKGKQLLRTLVYFSVILVSLASICNAQIFYNREEFLSSTAGTTLVNINFESISPNTNITNTSILGVEFRLLNSGCPGSSYGQSNYRCGTQSSAPLVVVENMAGLPATSGSNIISPGGADINTCQDPLTENDDLFLSFDNPVKAFGIDIIFKKADGTSFLGVRAIDSLGNILFEDSLIPIPDNNSNPNFGSQFVGFVSNIENIASVEIDEYDENCDIHEDEHVGYDSIVFSSLVSPGFGGSVIGMTPRNIICWNLTTGESVSFQTEETSWNCIDAGLIVRPRDRVFTGAEGIVDLRGQTNLDR